MNRINSDLREGLFFSTANELLDCVRDYLLRNQYKSIEKELRLGLSLQLQIRVIKVKERRRRFVREDWERDMKLRGQLL